MADDKPKVIRDTDDEARALARLLVASARFAAIAVSDPETGYPNSSRVLTGTDNAGRPVILVSQLSAHTRALIASPKCSLLVGEPGKGDPLAWPRLSLQCDAQPIHPDSPERPHIRARFLRKHRKAALYADFPDFLFFRLAPVRASLNGGFGKAFALLPEDLSFRTGFAPLSPDMEELRIGEAEKALESLSSKIVSARGWRICGIDAEGLDLEKNAGLKRITFPYPIDNEKEIFDFQKFLYNQFSST